MKVILGTNSYSTISLSGLSKQLKSMPFGNFFKTLISIYAVIIEAIGRTIGYHSILKELFDDAESRQLFQDYDPHSFTGPTQSQISSPGSPHDKHHGVVVHDLIQDSNSTIFTVADMGHVRCAKLVGVRADQNAQLNPTDFYRFFDATWAFINSSEEMCGRTSFGLRGAIISQVWLLYTGSNRTHCLTLNICTCIDKGIHQ
jgi:vacuolar protein sorting-associated protein 54